MAMAEQATRQQENGLDVDALAEVMREIERGPGQGHRRVPGPLRVERADAQPGDRRLIAEPPVTPHAV
jgi:hypothetical protein